MVTARVTPSTGVTCSAVAGRGSEAAPQLPVYLRHLVAELAASRVPFRKQTDPTSWQMDHAALMASGDRMIDAGIVQAQPLGKGAW